MIHYYSYYSVGGYKDMYLGNNASPDERAYYLPLLSVEQQQAEENQDATLLTKVERQSKLPKIAILTSQENYGLPLSANTLVTHGSYSIIYTHLENAKFIIVVRGITAEGTVPFLISIMSDSRDDISRMNRIAGYIAANTLTAKKDLSSFLHYDPRENGLCFEQRRMNQWIDQITANPINECIQLVNGKSLKINGETDKIGLLLVPNGINQRYALEELSLGKKDTNSFCELMVLPQDNTNEANRRRKWWIEEVHKRKLSLIKNIAFSVAAAIIIGGTLYMCTRN